MSHLPGRIKTKDTETKLASLFRAEEWPIPPDDDNLVLRPFSKEQLAAFVLLDGKIEVWIVYLGRVNGFLLTSFRRRSTSGKDTRVKKERNTDTGVNKKGKMGRW